MVSKRPRLAPQVQLSDLRPLSSAETTGTNLYFGHRTGAHSECQTETSRWIHISEIVWSTFLSHILQSHFSQLQVHDQMYVDADAHHMAQAAYAKKRRLAVPKAPQN